MEDIVKGYTTVKRLQGGYCGICFREAVDLIEIHQTWLFEADKQEINQMRGNEIDICHSCLDNIGRLFEENNRDKQIYNGDMEDIIA